MEALKWFTELTLRERRTVYAGFGGYAVDAFDFLIYPFLIPYLITAWGISKQEAGMIATSSLVSSALGGWVAGIFADRYGRVRVLQWTIAIFSVFTFLSGFTNSYWQLLTTRTLQGIGFGGEWSVVTIMVAETIRSPQHRAKAVGMVQSSWSIGWGAAAILYWVFFSLLPQHLASRACFWIGLVPALWIIYIRRKVSEPALYLTAKCSRAIGFDTSHFLQIFSLPHRKATLLGSGLCTGMLGGYYAITTWLPTYMNTVRHVSVFNTSGYLALVIIGSFCGYIVGAILCDVIGRRASFVLFALGAFMFGMVYAMLPMSDRLTLLLGFPLGFIMQGIFAGMGVYLSELYPCAIRGSGQSFCYNFGRGIGSLFPTVVGTLSQITTLTKAMGIAAGLGYLLVIFSALCLPETKGKSLIDTAKVGDYTATFMHNVLLHGDAMGCEPVGHIGSDRQQDMQ